VPTSCGFEVPDDDDCLLGAYRQSLCGLVEADIRELAHQVVQHLSGGFEARLAQVRDIRIKRMYHCLNQTR